MVTLEISLPDSLKTFVERQVAAGGFRDASAYMQGLLQDAYRVQQRAEMEAKILEGLDALDRGEGSEMTAQDWERLRAEFEQRVANRNGP